MPSKLEVYNAALREIGEHPLADLVTVNTQLTALNGAFDAAVPYVLAQVDWNYALGRAALATTPDTVSFPPYTQRYTKPANYLRKSWLKAQASDEFQIDHAEVGASIYGFANAPLLQFVSSAAANLDPANWPPQFARVLALYLGVLVLPKLAPDGGDHDKVWAKFQAALGEAETQEAVFATNQAIPAERLPVMRRAIEMMGQQLAGSVAIMSHADKLRWHMARAWDHSVRYLLEQGAWNYATKRALLHDGADPTGVIAQADVDGLIDGFSVQPTATVTITIAAPAVISWADHALPAGTPVVFSTTSALPTGITAGTVYWVLATGLAAGAFQIAATLNGAAINTSGTQAGVHTATVAEIEDDDAATLPDIVGFDYGFPLPNDFRHKIWIKADAGHDSEVPHQVVRDHIFTNFDPCVLEYVAEDEWTTDPRNWPATFLEAHAAYLALMVTPEFLIEQGRDGKAKISAPKVREGLAAIYEMKLSDAKAKDAIQQYPQRIPAGSFVRARMGYGGFASRSRWGR